MRHDVMWEQTIPLKLKKYVIVDTPEIMHGRISHSIAVINAADDLYLVLQSVETPTSRGYGSPGLKSRPGGSHLIAQGL